MNASAPRGTGSRRIGRASTGCWPSAHTDREREGCSLARYLLWIAPDRWTGRDRLPSESDGVRPRDAAGEPGDRGGEPALPPRSVHLVSAVGTQVTVGGRNPQLLPQEEPAISALLKHRMSRYCEGYTSYEAVRAEARDGRQTIVAVERESREERAFSGQEILIATGRRSNADMLQPEKSGAETDEHAVPHVVFAHPHVPRWAQPRHRPEKSSMCWSGCPGTATPPRAMRWPKRKRTSRWSSSGQILGAHIIGPHAAILVQWLVYLMNAGDGDYMLLARARTIHPALNEAVIGAFGSLTPVDGHQHHHDLGHHG